MQEDDLRRLHALVRDHPDFEVVEDPGPQRYGFRYVPYAVSERQHEPQLQALLDRLNQQLADSLAEVPLTATRIRGRVVLSVSTFVDVDRSFDAIAREGRRLAHDVLAARKSVAAQEEAC